MYRKPLNKDTALQVHSAHAKLCLDYYELELERQKITTVLEELNEKLEAVAYCNLVVDGLVLFASDATEQHGRVNTPVAEIRRYGGWYASCYNKGLPPDQWRWGVELSEGTTGYPNKRHMGVEWKSIEACRTACIDWVAHGKLPPKNGESC